MTPGKRLASRSLCLSLRKMEESNSPDWRDNKLPLAGGQLLAAAREHSHEKVCQRLDLPVGHPGKINVLPRHWIFFSLKCFGVEWMPFVFLKLPGHELNFVAGEVNHRQRNLWTPELTVAVHSGGWLRALLMRLKIVSMSLRKVKCKVCKRLSQGKQKRIVISLEAALWMFWHTASSQTGKNGHGYFKHILLISSKSSPRGYYCLWSLRP